MQILSQDAYDVTLSRCGRHVWSAMIVDGANLNCNLIPHQASQKNF